jgi:hypothetical protein
MMALVIDQNSFYQDTSRKFSPTRTFSFSEAAMALGQLEEKCFPRLAGLSRHPVY